MNFDINSILAGANAQTAPAQPAAQPAPQPAAPAGYAAQVPPQIPAPTATVVMGGLAKLTAAATQAARQAQSQEVIPAGDYKASVEKVVVENTDKGNIVAKTTFKLIDGVAAGRTITDFAYFLKNNNTEVNFGYTDTIERVEKYLGYPANAIQDGNALVVEAAKVEKLATKPLVTVKLTVENYNDKDRNNVSKIIFQ